MKKLINLLVVGSLILVLLSVVVSAHTGDDPLVTDLVAGQHIDVGDVRVWNDGNSLYIRYETTDSWCLTETHLHVATSLDDIPQVQGNPIPGRFGYGDEYTLDPCEQAPDPFEIPLGDWAYDEELYIAAHAVVVDTGSMTTSSVSEETAWGAGDDFPGKNWATYLPYTVQGEIPTEWPEGGTVTVAFEDLPIDAESDYDYNDWVVDIDTLATYWGTTAERHLLRIDFTIAPEARGAGYNHVFHLLIPADTFGCDGVSTLILYAGDGSVISQEIETFDASQDQDFVAIPWTGDALPDMTNTIEAELYTQPERTATLSIEYTDLCPFDLSVYDPYDPAQMHGEGLFFDPYLHVDDTGEQIHRADPRTLAVPADWMWPEEWIAIWLAYDPGVAPGSPPTFEASWWSNPTDLVYEGKP